MELLQERIRREGRVLPGNIVKVDGFLNHRVDTRLLEDIADEFAKYFDTSKITVVLTAEASGIALATICAQKYGVPMLFAKKAKSDNIESGLYQSEVFSYTYKKRVTLLVSQEWLNADDHVLIIDDFMANGFAVQGLVDIVNEAGAKLEGIGIAVERGWGTVPKAEIKEKTILYQSPIYFTPLADGQIDLPQVQTIIHLELEKAGTTPDRI